MNRIFINITKEVSVDMFRTIAAKILKEGGRGFYSNRYNNSPHYKLDSFNVYLNPIDPFTNITADHLSNTVSDYNEIVIQDFSSDIKYYHLILKDDLTVLLDCRDKDSVYMKKALMEKYLPVIEKVFYLNK